ncbi:septum formation initiator family protein [Arthrobacter sp. UYEF20]|uniref:FtsB family cell division protein n=1 Tax=Arthrobacter sp. UYEF20 TaxID=1756363 RepID=UPI0033910846
MATRRPKVPRATAPAPKSTDTGDGGDVILADFGGRAAQGDAAGRAPGSRHDAPQHDAPQDDAPRYNAGRATSGRVTSGTAAPRAQTTPAKMSTTKSGDAKSGDATSGDARTSTARTSTARTSTARTRGSKHGGTRIGGSKQPTAGPEETPVPARAFSGRMLALFVVMIAITIMLAPTVKIFFEKRAEIAALQGDISAKQSQQNDLKRQVSRWQDPNYVKQQARDRINMVMPGETGYWVFGSDLPAGEPGGAAGAASTPDPAKLPWVDTLWESIRRSATD